MLLQTCQPDSASQPSAFATCIHSVRFLWDAMQSDMCTLFFHFGATMGSRQKCGKSVQYVCCMEAGAERGY